MCNILDWYGFHSVSTWKDKKFDCRNWTSKWKVIWFTDKIDLDGERPLTAEKPIQKRQYKANEIGSSIHK
jgi:hypothetical protein